MVGMRLLYPGRSHHLLHILQAIKSGSLGSSLSKIVHMLFCLILFSDWRHVFYQDYSCAITTLSSQLVEVTLALSSSLHLHTHTQCMQACPATVSEGNWSSNLRSEITMAREVTLGWREDVRPTTRFYVVQFREVSVQTFNTSSPVSAYVH